jgi:hypothetical protein
MPTIIERIQSRPDLAEHVANRDLDAIVAELNAEGLTEVAECWVDALGIMNRCTNGKSILRKLRTAVPSDAVVEAVWTKLISGPGIDFGSQTTRDSIDEMVAPLEFTEDEVVEMKQLPVRPVVVDRMAVEAAINEMEG